MVSDAHRVVPKYHRLHCLARFQNFRQNDDSNRAGTPRNEAMSKNNRSRRERASHSILTIVNRVPVGPDRRWIPCTRKTVDAEASR